MTLTTSYTIIDYLTALSYWVDKMMLDEPKVDKIALWEDRDVRGCAQGCTTYVY